MTSRGSVLITGCTDGGIGSALAVTFQKRGFRVFATTRDPIKMSDLGLPNITRLPLDVTKQADISAAVEAVSKETGGTLDYLINNAARTHVSPVLDEDIEKAKSIFDTNLWGTIAVTQAFSPLIVKARGTIVFISSIQGYINAPFKATYAASKKAQEIFADTLRVELTPFRVSVTQIVTGMVLSNCHSYFDDFKLPEKSLYKPIEEAIGKYASGRAGMPTLEYAEHVVEVVLKRETEKYWFGPWAGDIKARMAPIMPYESTDVQFAKGTGLDTWDQ
ncbi:NAD(P)-binding protein [Byssothecium circinans]|uniref:NAD(P)-binding protein n=1 Tax=Byssothecium circinans TaxID=147558 RepID=A0A6A5TS99_9PLEO|nr:NAD(P)-binding protein [Byssothecium circinans]